MPLTVRTFIVPVAVLVAAAAVSAQRPQLGEDELRQHVPAKPATRRELDQLEALKLYAVAVTEERSGLLVEASRTYEAARRLDPDSAAIHRGLAGLYLGLERIDDALDECRRVLELEPDDFAVGYVYSRQLRLQNKSDEARTVLARIATLPALADRPDLQVQVQFDLGVLYDEAKDWLRAEAAYRAALVILENNDELGNFTKDDLRSQAAEVYERVGRVALKQKKIERAVADFMQARKKDPARSPRLSLHLAEVYAKLNRNQEAMENLNEFLSSQPEGMDGYEMKIRLLHELKRDADVVPELEAAAARDKHNLALQLLLARECRKAGKIERAQAIYDGLVREFPTVEVYRGMFAMFKEEGERGAARALDLFDGAMKKTKKDEATAEATQAKAMLGAMREDAELIKLMLPVVRRRLRDTKRTSEDDGLSEQTHLLFATLAARGDQAEAAEELYRNLLNRRDLPQAMESEAYFGLLQVLESQRKNSAIIEVCKRGLEHAEATNRVLFHIDLAHAYAALGDDDKAVAAADDAVADASDKQRMRCRLSRARVLAECADKARQQKGVAECLALLKEYNLAEEVRTIRYSLSGVYSIIGDQQKSEEVLQLILDADPNDASACNDLGYLWADQNKNLPEAEKLIRKALDLDRKQRAEGPNVQADADKDNGAFVDSLGWVLFRRGQLAAARRELERVPSLPSGADDPVVWDHLGDVCFRMGDKPAAEKAWKKALGLYQSGVRRTHTKQAEDLKEKIRLLSQ